MNIEYTLPYLQCIQHIQTEDSENVLQVITQCSVQRYCLADILMLSELVDGE